MSSSVIIKMQSRCTPLVFKDLTPYANQLIVHRQMTVLMLPHASGVSGTCQTVADRASLVRLVIAWQELETAGAG